MHGGNIARPYRVRRGIFRRRAEFSSPALKCGIGCPSRSSKRRRSANQPAFGSCACDFMGLHSRSTCCAVPEVASGCGRCPISDNEVARSVRCGRVLLRLIPGNQANRVGAPRGTTGFRLAVAGNQGPACFRSLTEKLLHLRDTYFRVDNSACGHDHTRCPCEHEEGAASI